MVLVFIDLHYQAQNYKPTLIDTAAKLLFFFLCFQLYGILQFSNVDFLRKIKSFFFFVHNMLLKILFPHCKPVKYLEVIVLNQVTVNKTLVQVRL